MASPKESAAELSEYRKHLVLAEQKSQEDFDKTVLSLSGGALGISFIFLKDVIGASPVSSGWLLLAAWIAWGLSASFVLVSFYLSHLALRAAIKQVDTGTLQGKKAGGGFATATSVLNVSGATAFFVGVVLMTCFAGSNLKRLENPHGSAKSATTSTTPPAAAPATPATPATSTAPAR